jgi:hypothetical protein
MAYFSPYAETSGARGNRGKKPYNRNISIQRIWALKFIAVAPEEETCRAFSGLLDNGYHFPAGAKTQVTAGHGATRRMPAPPVSGKMNLNG